jgi:hypothetical protein
LVDTPSSGGTLPEAGHKLNADSDVLTSFARTPSLTAMNRFRLACLLFALSFSCPLFAQDSGGGTSDEAGQDNFWELSLPGGGHFMVALDRIASISKSNYLLDGGLIVTEVSIDTNGSALCRIYQIVPAAESAGSDGAKVLAERARQGVNRASEMTGSELADMVQKSYPTTTHAKTIEYRVRDKETLEKLYQSLSTAWSRGKGRRFTIEN